MTARRIPFQFEPTGIAEALQASATRGLPAKTSAAEILRMRKSAPIEGREAGQSAADKRGAASKARI